MSEASSVFSVMQKARKGERLNVVFFGGSLTWGANASDPDITSWRGLTMQMLYDRYPEARWRFKDAAIGGTGSTLGVFRMQRDVFDFKPDLVFLDFTLNDNLDGGENALHDWKNHSYERIIRECVSRKIAVLPVFLTAKRHTEIDDISKLKRRLEHIRLFSEYNLEYADVLGLMNEAYHSGLIDTSVVWQKEAVHPLDAGYAVYARYFNKEWERIENSAEKVPVLPDDFVCGKEFFNILRVDLYKENLPGWKTDFPCVVSDCFDWLASRWLDKVVEESAENGKFQPLTFNVKARRVAAMVETMPNSAPFAVSVDGAEPQVIKVREVLRSQLHYVMLADNLEPDRTHTVTIIPQGDTGVIRLGAVLLGSEKDIVFIL